ncbi:hypothetical protein V8G54_007457 [Vigna mungo]|uniref:Retrotransposon gag domain-containing protein n=1 Tax=Vigna mungo TaxID=3915 RepID=A0AAQ3P1W8_VIGMU
MNQVRQTPLVNDGSPCSFAAFSHYRTHHFVAFSHYRPRQSVMAIPVVLMQVSSLLDGAILSKSPHLKFHGAIWSFLIRNLSIWSDLPDHLLERSCDGAMEKAITTRFEAIEITVEELKAESVAVRRDLQRILTMLEKKGDQTDSSSEEDTSVNDNKDRVNGRTGGSETGERSGEQKLWRKRIELPTFDGEEPLSWLNRAERFFDIQKVEDDDEKVEVAYVSMEGSAAYWFTFWKEKSSNKSWQGLKEAMINHFCVGTRGTVFERLATIRQERTVEEFVRQFEILTGQTKGIPEDQVLGYFLAGLREEVKGQVRIQNPTKLMEAMRIARDVEDAMMRTPGSHFGGAKMNPAFRTQQTHNEFVRENRNGRSRKKRRGKTVRLEAMEGPERSEIYPTQSISREEKRAYVSDVAANSHPDIEDEDGEETETTEDQGEKLMELSACLVEGWTNPGTMKTRGKIGDRSVVILIDSGASHNYISKGITEELGLPITKTKPYSVSLGDGCKRTTQGRCERVKVRLEEVELEEEFHVFELGGVDAILGVAWLEKLGEVRTNWGKMTMAYNVGDKKNCIKGNPTLSRQLVNSRSLLKLVEAESWAAVWNLCIVEAGDSDLTYAQRIELNKGLQEHYPLLQDLHGLPLPHNKGHRIQLKEGVDPINGGPCQYPYPMKCEIERQVEGMLKAGINRPDERQLSLAAKVPARARRFIKRPIGKNKTAPLFAPATPPPGEEPVFTDRNYSPSPSLFEPHSALPFTSGSSDSNLVAILAGVIATLKPWVTGLSGQLQKAFITVYNQFPELNLEDKVENGGEGNDRMFRAEEDHDGDETWDPDSDMDVDVERELVPSKVKKEIVEPQLNGLVPVSCIGAFVACLTKSPLLELEMKNTMEHRSLTSFTSKNEEYNGTQELNLLHQWDTRKSTMGWFMFKVIAYLLVYILGIEVEYRAMCHVPCAMCHVSCCLL